MAATAEEVDELIRKFERDVERQVATMGSAVKGVAAERDVLKTAEHARDLLGKCVKGEKDALDRIFGGSCERIGRLRIALDQVTFSDMHAKDSRWKHLRGEVETIESVLRDLGTFKPWVPPAVKPPERITYKGRRRLSPGRRVNMKPEVEGGEAQAWEVDPPLPASLELSPSTGVISGILQPQVLVEEMVYVVIGRNAAGEARTELVFAVKDAPPLGITYPALSIRDNVCVGCVIAGEKVAWEPEVDGNVPSSWEVEPALPEGLLLDPATGTLRGAAAVVAPPTEYVISAANSGGKTTVIVNLEVRLSAPAALSYPSLPERLNAGQRVEFAPSIRGAPSEWSISPDLPEGLHLDPARGVISGSPAIVADTRSWMVTARNEAGEVRSEISFAVQLGPPESLQYPAAVGDLALLEPVLLRPTCVGQVESFSVRPLLPAGLQLDEATGEISGAPEEAAEEASYVVTAQNATGSTTVTLTFAIRVTPPTELDYGLELLRCVLGEEVSVSAKVKGSACSFSVEPPLPAKLVLDEASGAITGAAEAVSEASYAVTARNDAGAVTRELTISVVPPAPEDFTYPGVSESYAVGEPLSIEPHLDRWVEGSFSVTPALPAGLALDTSSGVISGVPAEVHDRAMYSITARNVSGSASAEVSFAVIEAVDEKAVADSINKDFANKLEGVTDLVEMPPEPTQVKMPGDWMMWMVHRAHLNDPDLVELNFNNMHMPPPHVEARIAPKLVKAMQTNTHIEVLSLVNSNLMKSEGVELAAALETNCTVRVLNLEVNCLDSNAVKEIAQAILKNSGSVVEHLRLSPQKQVGSFFGRPVEEAVGMMMDKNNSIIKLGFECNDAHWRNLIDRALLRNNDFARRRRKAGYDGEDDTAHPEERALGRLVLEVPPSKAFAAVFSGASPSHSTFCGFVARERRLPNTTQLQNYARNNGKPLKYSEVAPLLKECRSRMLDAAVETEVTVADVFEVDARGTLKAWTTNNDNWTLDLKGLDGKRFSYKSNKEPTFMVSDAWALWLAAEESR